MLLKADVLNETLEYHKEIFTNVHVDRQTESKNFH